MTGFDPLALITTASSGLKDDLGGVAAIGLGVGAVVFATTKGWSLLKRFVG